MSEVDFLLGRVTDSSKKTKVDAAYADWISHN